MPRFLLVLVGAAVGLSAAGAEAQDATTPGEVTTPHPTLEHLSIEWAVDGDADGDGVVTVRYREQGTDAWREGHPLFRVPAGSNEGHSWQNRHAGSLFGLRPGTSYEIELALADPDGGDATRTVTARTRPVPTVPDGAPAIDVTPDTIGSALSSVSPGDVLELGPGTYGSIYVSASGEPGAPIVLRGSDVADVVVEGEVRMDSQSHVWIEDMTVRGQVKFNDSAGIVVRGCRIETDRDGIVAYGSGTEDGYFADNVVLGPTEWHEGAFGASGDNLGEGIVMTGPGNVIAHNRIEAFRDCVSLLEGDLARSQLSVDIVGNELARCADDAIEADFAMGNVRVLRNRSANSFIAWSSQPGLGGPTYFVRNVAFANFFQVLKPNRGSLGDVLYHNTVVKQGDALGVYTGTAWGRLTSRNNIFIGGPEEATANGFSTGPGRIMALASLETASSSLDYDGFGSIELGRFDGRFGDTSFGSFAELRSMTTEAHAVQVDLSIFASDFDFPRSMFPALEPVDLRLAEGAAAVDAGVTLSGINDGFAGAAPDLGAYELGSALPTYGPRTGGPVCGDGVIGEGEQCDDANTVDGDGCSSDCRRESPGADGGAPGSDGGATDGGSGRDGGGSDGGGAGAGGDGGAAEEGSSGGCGCGVPSRGDAGGGVLLAGLVLLVLVRRRR